MLIDTHIHLDLKEFRHDYQDVINRSREAGFVRLINVGINLPSVKASRKLAETNEDIFFTVGVHPHDVKKIKPDDWQELEKEAGHPKAVAIGEAGLDFYRNISPPSLQKEAFRKHLRLAKKLNKPLVIHSRMAMSETLKLVAEEGLSKRGGVMHCFNGSYEDFSACQKLGLSVSIGGPLTYPKNQELREIIKKIPLESLLLETDAPYLSPQNKRGKRNEPAYLKEVVACLAALRGFSEADIARITTTNAALLFSLGLEIEREKIAYPIRDSLYLNITNQCTNQCSFCIRFQPGLLRGYNLRLQHEPTVEEIIASMGELPLKYKEVVFCGYGEPTMRLDDLLAVSRYIKETFNKPVRLNTNGHFYLLHDKSRLQELSGLIDAVSISFNTADSEQYNQICLPRFPGDVLKKIIAFTNDAKAVIPSVTITALNMPRVDIKALRRLAENLGVKFRQREYNEAG